MPPQMVAANDTSMTKSVALSGTLPTASQKSSSREKVSVVDSVKPRIREPLLPRLVNMNREPVKMAVETM